MLFDKWLRAAKALSKPTDGIISRYVNRKLSAPISLFIVEHNIPITPNHMTLISFLCALASMMSFVLDMPFLGGVLAQVTSVLDGVDGEIARLRNMKSSFGAYLDSVLDRFADCGIVVSFVLFLLRHLRGLYMEVSILGMVAVFGMIIHSYVHNIFKAHFNISPADVVKHPSLASRDVRLFLIFIGCILGFYFETLIALALISTIGSTIRFIELLSKAKSLGTGSSC
ncbi:MAG: CDP-alcohol phosphatidyltransferase family protein [Thermoprotei archaeon]|nr:MAG: CDP-alcohol phosphatidyltransferase family protein [Thermoprotei archaeon]